MNMDSSGYSFNTEGFAALSTGEEIAVVEETVVETQDETSVSQPSSHSFAQPHISTESIKSEEGSELVAEPVEIEHVITEAVAVGDAQPEVFVSYEAATEPYLSQTVEAERSSSAAENLDKSLESLQESDTMTFEHAAQRGEIQQDAADSATTEEEKDQFDINQPQEIATMDNSEQSMSEEITELKEKDNDMYKRVKTRSCTSGKARRRYSTKSIEEDISNKERLTRLTAKAGSPSVSQPSRSTKVNMDPQHGQVLLQTAHALMQDHKLLDITLVCEGQELMAHRLVLVTYSRLLHTILTESKDSLSHLSLDYLQIRAESLATLVNFMYTGSMEMQRGTRDELLQAAKVLEIPKAVDELERSRHSVGHVCIKLEPVDLNMTSSTPASTPRKRGRPPGSTKDKIRKKLHLEESRNTKNKEPAGHNKKTTVVVKEEEPIYEPDVSEEPMSSPIHDEPDSPDVSEDESPLPNTEVENGDVKDHETEMIKTRSGRGIVVKVKKTYSGRHKKTCKPKIIRIIQKAKKSSSSFDPDLIYNPEKPPKEELEFKVKSKLVERTKKVSKYRHLKQADGLYHCPEEGCSYSTRADQNIARHILTQHSDERPHQCTYCEKAFKLKKYLVEHVRTHTDERPYACEICGVKFRAAKHRNRHRKIHTGEKGRAVPAEKTHSCTECGKTFAAAFNLTKHVKSVHEGEKPYKCDHADCEYATISASALKSHSLAKHSDLREHILCDICGRAFKTKQSMQVHKLATHEEAIFKCPHCPYKSGFKTGIASHVKRKHGVMLDGTIASPRFQCELCEYSCFTRHEFERHVLNHKGEKPFKCPVCPYATVEKMNLKFHMRVHTGEKPHECKICHKKFPRTLGLKRHMLVHTGDKPHKCTECEMAYADKKSLETHRYSQHLHIKPYMCDICSYACVKRENLTNHMRKVHNVSKTTQISITPLKNVQLPNPYAAKRDLQPEPQTQVTQVLRPADAQQVIQSMQPATAVTVPATEFQQTYAEHYQTETITVYSTDAALEMVPVVIAPHK